MIPVGYLNVLDVTKMEDECSPLNPVDVIGNEVMLACKDEVGAVLYEKGIGSQEPYRNCTIEFLLGPVLVERYCIRR